MFNNPSRNAYFQAFIHRNVNFHLNTKKDTAATYMFKKTGGKSHPYDLKQRYV